MTHHKNEHREKTESNLTSFCSSIWGAVIIWHYLIGGKLFTAAEARHACTKTTDATITASRIPNIATYTTNHLLKVV